jgi:hypothetical protein
MTVEDLGPMPDMGIPFIRAIVTEAGVYDVGIRRGVGLVVFPPGGPERAYPESRDANDFALVVIGGELCADYTGAIDGVAYRRRRLHTGIAVGRADVAATGPPGPRGEPGERGPQGPPGPKGADAVAVSDADADKIALRVLTLPPAADHAGLPPQLWQGTRLQEHLLIPFRSPNVWFGLWAKIKQGWAIWKQYGDI